MRTVGETSAEAGPRAVVGRLLTVVRGRTDPRLRATWRVLLAVPLLLLTGGLAQAIAPATGLEGLAALVSTGLLQAGVFVVLLVVWARYVDRRRLSAYGFAISGSWLAALGVAFAAVVVAQSVWHAAAAALGWTSIEVVTAAPAGSLAVALAAGFVAVAVNVWVQDTVYCGVVLQNAAEGLRARDVAARAALLGGWVACVLYVVGIHSGSLRRPGLFVAGAFFGLLYLHTGELALPIGFHLGVNFTGGWVFAPASLVGERATVFAVSGAHPLVEAASGPAIPQMVLAYLLVVGWLRWRRCGVSLNLDVGAWTPR